MNSCQKGQKTILVVDDDALVLNFVGAILRRNYHVLLASGPMEALRTESGYSDVIDLLLSDITMPLMSGSQLATEILLHRPDIRVMFMSGYYEGPLLILNHGWRFIQKPFLVAELLDLVNETLSSTAIFQGTDRFDTRY